MGALARWNTLVQAEELAQALGRDDLVVVDARASLADPDSARRAWELGHLPGARFAHLEEDLSDHALVGGRHPWPDAEAFTAKLGRWGISPRYHQPSSGGPRQCLHAPSFLRHSTGHQGPGRFRGSPSRFPCRQDHCRP